MLAMSISAHDPKRAFRRDMPHLAQMTPVPCGASYRASDDYPAKMHKLHHASWLRSALASCRTGVSKPSVNQP
jgi:hypothetical protein